MTKKVFIDPNDIDASLIKAVAEVCLGGGIVALPTETVYGLAACAHDPAVVEKLRAIKNRPAGKPFAYAVSDKNNAINNYLSTLTPFGYRLIEKFWPGPLTIIYYSKEDEIIGVRVPAHPVAREILKAIGKKVFLPSANVSGEKEAVTAQEVEAALSGKINLVVDSGSLTYNKASTVIDLTYRPFKILREGVVSEREIIDVFIKKRILFVCTGNTCRSPMAQFLFKKYFLEAKPYFSDRFEIISRGVSAYEGARISSPAASILRENEDIDTTSFRSKKIDRQTLLSSDLIFTMEAGQNAHILNMEPTIKGRMFPLVKFITPEPEADIPDPIGKSYEDYEKVYSLIKKAIMELKNWL